MCWLSRQVSCLRSTRTDFENCGILNRSCRAKTRHLAESHWQAIWSFTLLAALTSCRPVETRVDAADHDAFWLWAGVKPQPVLERANTIYILQGEVKGREQARLVSLRPGTPAVRHAQLWIVYRVESLHWDDAVLPRIRADLARWQAAGNCVIGVQIDFDAATYRLSDYARFLRDLRGRLPDDTKLGITGLLDWSSQGDSADLAPLADTVDEIVIQTYQGRHTIPGYQPYLDRLSRLDMRYKIGLVQGGEWREPRALRADRDFSGYVVFLLNHK